MSRPSRSSTIKSAEYAYFYHIRPDITQSSYIGTIFSSKDGSHGLTLLEKEEHVTEENAKAWALDRIHDRIHENDHGTPKCDLVRFMQCVHTRDAPDADDAP